MTGKKIPELQPHTVERLRPLLTSDRPMYARELIAKGKGLDAESKNRLCRTGILQKQKSGTLILTEKGREILERLAHKPQSKELAVKKLLADSIVRNPPNAPILPTQPVVDWLADFRDRLRPPISPYFGSRKK